MWDVVFFTAWSPKQAAARLAHTTPAGLSLLAVRLAVTVLGGRLFRIVLPAYGAVQHEAQFALVTPGRVPIDVWRESPPPLVRTARRETDESASDRHQDGERVR